MAAPNSHNPAQEDRGGSRLFGLPALPVPSRLGPAGRKGQRLQKRDGVQRAGDHQLGMLPTGGRSSWHQGFRPGYARLCPVLELQDRGGGVHHHPPVQVCGRRPCVASSPHGLVGPVLRHAGLAVRGGKIGGRHGRNPGEHRARPSQVACPAPGRRRSDLGPQTRPRLLQMVGQMAEHGRGDAIRHQVVRPGSRCPYGTACMVP